MSLYYQRSREGMARPRKREREGMARRVGEKMIIRRLLLAPFVLAVLLSPVPSPCHGHVLPVGQKGTAASQKKTAQVHYVCPMHSDVTSKSRGVCPKCKMSLVKKRAVRTTALSGS
jgi:Heavy metal binding domain